jgi:1,2-phenylacetyl-CoA epoxidase catalytic subunit
MVLIVDLNDSRHIQCLSVQVFTMHQYSSVLRDKENFLEYYGTAIEYSCFAEVLVVTWLWDDAVMMEFLRLKGTL